MNWVEFAAIALAHLLAVASPGPDFAIVLRQTLRHGSVAGIWSSAGIAAGIGLHVSYCLLGVAVLIAGSPEALSLLKLGAACLLIFIGVQSLRSAQRSWGRPMASTPSTEPNTAQLDSAGLGRSAFLAGFMTNGLNPKATLFFLALFSVVIDPSTPMGIQLGYGLYLCGATFLWFTVLSLLVGRQSVRERVLRSTGLVDGVMGLVLLALSAQLLLSEVG